jgi:anaerobic magnesium-protoporphyrin IX monomethyl ester cyclase
VIRRTLFHRDPDYRHAMRWYTRIGRRVWFHEVMEFLFKRRPRSIGPTLRVFLGESLAEREYALSKKRSAQAKLPSFV